MSDPVVSLIERSLSSIVLILSVLIPINIIMGMSGVMGENIEESKDEDSNSEVEEKKEDKNENLEYGYSEEDYN